MSTVIRVRDLTDEGFEVMVRAMLPKRQTQQQQQQPNLPPNWPNMTPSEWEAYVREQEFARQQAAANQAFTNAQWAWPPRYTQ